MSVIHVLEPEISNKIAAGEVVERPASVVKELVENSIDAGATKISVEIKNGGISYISVTDNGCGMATEDAQVAFLRHATSKIKTESDLDAIYTLGFRGEALSSIGAVSEATIYTKQVNSDFGTVVSCEGGEIIASEEGGMSDGTKIIIRNLFYNTPARMKFLKKDSTESGYVADVMTRFVLAHPEISFRFIKNGKDVFVSSGDGNLKNAVYAVYGRDYANNLININYTMDGIKVNGAVGNSKLSRPNRSFQSFFVNRRYIKSPLVIRAVEEAFKNQIMIGKFPVAVINIEINPSLIDINVHPTKLEVKFSDDKKIYDAVYYGTKNALYAIPDKVTETKHDPKINPFMLKDYEDKVVNESVPKKTETKPELDEHIKEIVPEFEKVKNQNSVPVQLSVEITEDPLAAFRKKNELKPEQTLVFAEPKTEIKINHKANEVQKEQESDLLIQNKIELPSDNLEHPKQVEEYFKVIGQLFNTYIIIEKDNQMMLIDQHAAHERIKYEQLLNSLDKKECFPQILLEPVIIKLSGAEFSVYENNVEHLSCLGFETETFGETEIIVRGAPQDVECGDVEDLMLELISEMQSSKKEVISASNQRLIYTIACKSAVKANHNLTENEMRGLVKSVFQLEKINTCPHGRPITVSLTKKELEKMFKRIV